MEKFNSRFNLSEEKTCKLENKSEGNTQNVKQRKNIKESLRGLEDRLRRFNTQLIISSEFQKERRSRFRERQ